MATKIDSDYQWLPSSGNVSAQVVLTRWADHKSRQLPTRAQIDLALNGEPPYNSVQGYFSEQSKGKLALGFSITDWIDVPFTEYDARNKGDLVIQFLASRLPMLIRQDKPTIICHSGYDAASKRTSADGVPWERRHWSHLEFQPLIPGQNEPLAKIVIVSALHGIAGNVPLRPGVFSHEFTHTMGIVHHDLLPEGELWCIMVNMYQFSPGGYYPAPLCADCKTALGWLEPPAVVEQPMTFQYMDNPNAPDGVVVCNLKTMAALLKAIK